MGIRRSVLMVVNGNTKSDSVEIPSFVKSQIQSVRDAKWEVSLGIIDDRTSLRGIYRNSRKLKQQCIEVRPGVVHVQYGSVTAAVANYAKINVPLVVSFCGDDLLGTPVPGLLWRIREHLARQIGLMATIGKVKVIIVKSKNLLAELPSFLVKKVVVLPNGVDTSWFKPLDTTKCRERLNWEQKEKIVLFNASKRDNKFVKNFPLANSVMNIVRKSAKNVVLKTMANSNWEKVSLMLNAANCLLVTSLHEGSPNIVKEAMACNLPVVSVNCGDVKERLSKVYPGEICSYNANELANAIIKIVNEGRRSNGRDQILYQRLTLSHVTGRLIQIYQNIQK